MSQYPTEWQRKILWTTATALMLAVAGVTAGWLISLFGQAIGFLQPVLIPFAVAAVLAYLLDPVVRMITRRTRLSRTPAVVVVLALVVLTAALLLIAIVPQLYGSTEHFIRNVPAYTYRAQQRLLSLAEFSEKKINQLNKLFPTPKPSPTPAADLGTVPTDDEPLPDGSQVSPTPLPSVWPPPSPAPAADPTPVPVTEDRFADIRDYIQKQLPALGARVPAIMESGMHLLLRSIGGVLGVAGLLVNAIIIPVYLYFLLVESHNIAKNWSGLLPLRDSPLKKEVVSVMLEINGYLVAFFRGQLIVSTIDGILIGLSLYLFVGLDFSFFMTLLVVVMTFIPYLGIILCYIPAVLIAVLQFGDWQHPLGAAACMFVVQTLESTIIAPKVVGDSVGLHPMTVILSVFGWSLLLGGPIGAILAVPLTATIKVLMRRYIWERGTPGGRHLVPLTAATAPQLDKTAWETRAAQKSDAAAARSSGGDTEQKVVTDTAFLAGGIEPAPETPGAVLPGSKPPA